MLSRLTHPAEAQRLIDERQKSVDVDEEEAAIVEKFVEAKLIALGYDAEIACVHIPNTVATQWVNQATNQARKTTGVTRLIKQFQAEGKFKSLGIDKDRSDGRGLRWLGARANPMAMHRDLEKKIGDKLLKQRQLENLAPQEATSSF